MLQVRYTYLLKEVYTNSPWHFLCEKKNGKNSQFTPMVIQKYHQAEIG